MLSISVCCGKEVVDYLNERDLSENKYYIQNNKFDICWLGTDHSTSNIVHNHSLYFMSAYYIMPCRQWVFFVKSHINPGGLGDTPIFHQGPSTGGCSSINTIYIFIISNENSTLTSMTNRNGTSKQPCLTPIRTIQNCIHSSEHSWYN